MTTSPTMDSTTAATTPRRHTIAVIMPALNEAAAVETTFASIFSQTRLPEEIVVADGGSTDGTPELVRAYDGHLGIRVICVPNPERFCGGGRNAAFKAASASLLVGMDFGNRADPHYIERMEQAFLADPSADYAGGPHFALTESAFERAYAAVIDYWGCMCQAMSEAQMLHFAKQLGFLPGGMNLAITRDFYIRSGGFPAWAGSCDDVLMGMRARHLNARILPVPGAVVWYHMGRSTDETWRRLRNYSRWNARLGIQLGVYRTLFLVTALVVGLLVAGCWWWPMALIGLGVAIAWPTSVGLRRQWRTLRALKRSGSFADYAWSVWLAVVCDLATLRGLFMGLIDRVREPEWPARTRRWVEAPATT